MRSVLAVLTILVCGNAVSSDLSKTDAATIAAKAKTEMVGMSKGELFVCAGAPESIKPIDDYDFFTYKSHSRKSLAYDVPDNPKPSENADPVDRFRNTDLSGLSGAFLAGAGNSPGSRAAGLAQLQAQQERERLEREAELDRQARLDDQAVVYLSCEATFVIKDDRIESVVYKGQTGEPGAKDFMCGYVVEGCVKGSR